MTTSKAKTRTQANNTDDHNGRQRRASAAISIFTLFIIACFFIATPELAYARNEAYLSEKQAKEEITTAVTFLKETHPNPFWHTSQGRFEFELEKISAFEGEVSLAQHYFNLSKLYALVLDTHTQLYPSENRPIIPNTFPIRVRLFSEGLYIIGAGDPYRDFVGKRIVNIGGQPTAAVINQLAEYAFSDNFFRKRVFSEIYFYWPEMYHVLGLTDTDGGVTMQLKDINGNTETVRLTETNSKSFSEHFGKLYTATGTDPLPEGWTGLDDIFDIEKPLYLKNKHKNYAYVYLPEEKAMYVQINRPDNQEGEITALEFNLEWFDLLRKSEVERFILDLRNNPGGWINVTAPIPALLSAYRVNDPEKNLNKYIVLTSTDSVSAASTATAAMETEFSRTITIGQPTGSRPYLFLNTENLTLPYSKIELSVSTTAMPQLGGDDRMFIAPDISIGYSFNDYISGKDPVLTAALDVTDKMIDSFHEDRPPMRAWLRKSQKIADPRPTP